MAQLTVTKREPLTVAKREPIAPSGGLTIAKRESLPVTFGQVARTNPVLRMIMGLFEPVEPVKQATRRMATAIEGVERPAQEGSLLESAKEAVSSPGSAFRAAAELTGLPNILRGLATPFRAMAEGSGPSYSPAARVAAGLPEKPTLIENLEHFARQNIAQARGFGAGVVEAAGLTSPIEAALLAGGRRAGRATRPPRKGAPQRPAPDIRIVDEESLKDLASRLEKISEETTGTQASPRPVDLTPTLRKRATIDRGTTRTKPEAAAARHVQRSIEEPMDVAGARRRRSLEARRGKLAGTPAKAKIEDAIAAAVKEVLEPEPPARVSLPPSELPPMPRTGGRESGTTRSRTIPEPGGALGLGEDSAAAARRAGSVGPNLVRQRREAQAREIDRIAEREIKIEEARIRKIAREAEKRSRASKQGALREDKLDLQLPGEPLPLSRMSPRERRETLAVRKAAIEEFKRQEAARAQETPGLAENITPERLGPDLTVRRGRFLKQLNKLETGDSALDKKLTRFNYLAKQDPDKMSTARAAEMAKLERDILANPKLPKDTKVRWINLNKAVEKARTPIVAEEGPIRVSSATKPTASEMPKPIKGGKVTRFDERGIALPTGAAHRVATGGAEGALPKLAPMKKPTLGKNTAARSEQLASNIINLGQPLPARIPVPPPEVATAASTAVLEQALRKANPRLATSLEQSRQALDQPGVRTAAAGAERIGPQGRVPNPRLFQQEPGTPRVNVSPEEIVAINRMRYGTRPPPRATIKAPEGFEYPKKMVPARSAQVRNAREALTRLLSQFDPQRKPTPDAPSVRSASELGLGGVASIPVAPRRGTIFEKVQEIQARRRAQRLAAEGQAVPAAAGAAASAEPRPVSSVAPEAPAPAPSPVRPSAPQGAKAATSAKTAPRTIEELVGPVPEGIDRGAWHSIRATESAARELLRRGVKDFRMWQAMRDFWGSEEAARRIGVPKKELTDQIGALNKKRPMNAIIKELDDRMQHLIDDPNGFMRTEALAASAAAAVGATVGATLEGEDPIDRVSYAISGALLGGALGFGGVRGLRQAYAHPSTKAAKSIPRMVEALDTAHLLAGWATVKASLGSMGGVAHAILERLAEGRKADAMRGIRALKEAPGVWLNTVKMPTAQLPRMSSASMANYAAGQAGIATWPEKIQLHVLRPFIASDRAGQHVLQRMGYSRAEADRLMLQGHPTSWMGQSLLEFINTNMALRMFAKFARVRVVGLERAFEGLPFAPSPRSTKAHPRFRSSFIRQEGLSPKAARARKIAGTSMLAAGTIYGYVRDPGLQEMSVMSAASPFSTLTAAGMAAGKGIRRGTPGVLEAVRSVAASTPQIGEGEFTTGSLKRRVPFSDYWFPAE